MRADLSLVLITLIWGASYAIVKLSLAQVSPILFIALRFWVGTILVALWVPRALRGFSVETLRRGAVLSLLLLSGFILQTLGLRGTVPSRSAFVTSLTVLLVPVLGSLLFRYRPRARTLAGVAIAVVGLGLLTLQTITMAFTWGDGLTLLGAAVFALHILFIGRYLEGSDFRQLAVLQLAGSALLCTLLLPMLETPFIIWDPAFAAYLFVVGVFATGLAFYLQNQAQQFTTPNRTALIFSLGPFFAALFSQFFLDQAVTGRWLWGGLLVLAGILISELGRNTVTDARPVEEIR